MNWPGLRTALRLNSRSISSNYTASLNDFTIRCDCTAGNVVVGLPKAADANGQMIIVKKIDAGINQAIIDPNGVELIDGGASVAIGTLNDTKIIQSNGTSWDILNVGGI